VRILLDESLPRTLTRHFSGIAVETVYDRGWAGLENGELLELAGESFDAFFTADQNLRYQQNLKGYPIRVVVLAAVTNRVVDLLPLLDRALELAGSLSEGEVGVVRGDAE
jgi:predicted nuclease of predicted toxin-antitoxin system